MTSPIYAGGWLEGIRTKDGHHLAMIVKKTERVFLLIIRRQCCRSLRSVCLDETPGELRKRCTNLVEAFGAARGSPHPFQKVHHVAQEMYVLRACRCNCVQENDNERCERATVENPVEFTR